MYAARSCSLGIAFAAVLLQACTAMPSVDAAKAPPASDSVPELNLNLDHQDQRYPASKNLASTPSDAVDYTFLDRGFSALSVGDHTEAVRNFQRYGRLESSAVAQWEADIAVAYDSMLPKSPFYDPQAARKAFYRLNEQQPEVGGFNEKSLFMRDALATFVFMKAQISELQDDNVSLSEELDKLEEALRRLRELTLGQKAAAP